MSNFFATAKENLSFVLVCLLVTAGLILIADLAERLVMKKRHRLRTARAVAYIGMFAAVATVLHMLDFPLFFAPSCYKFDFSELPVMICTFYLGPVSSRALQPRSSATWPTSSSAARLSCRPRSAIRPRSAKKVLSFLSASARW